MTTWPSSAFGSGQFGSNTSLSMPPCSCRTIALIKLTPVNGIVSRARSSGEARRFLDQCLPVDLVCARERQFLHELDVPRVLVGRRVRQRILLDLLRRELRPRAADDEGDRLLAAHLVRNRNHRGLDDV